MEPDRSWLLVLVQNHKNQVVNENVRRLLDVILLNAYRTSNDASCIHNHTMVEF